VHRRLHAGSGFGETPTQREIVVHWMRIRSITGGRIVEDWETIDFDGCKRQLRSSQSAA